MKSFNTAALTCLLLCFLSACRENAPRIGLLSEAPTAEQDSLLALLARNGFPAEAVPLGAAARYADYDLLWYHRSDTSALSEEEKAAGEGIVRYVEKGGRLVLSMDAVRLSEAWGIESAPVEIRTHEAVDYGFGRKKGFHAFRSHPLFDDLFGGAYTWHGHEDNVCRVLGYFGDRLPERPGTKIVATLWELIYYHPSDKIIWETPLGKGKILSVGAFLYYGRENLHAATLAAFTRNIANYMAGRKGRSPERYWTYGPAETVPFSPRLSAVRYSGPVRWHLETEADTLQWTATGEEVTVPGQRCMTVLTERAGIKEIWTHPVMSLRDLKTTVVSGGKEYLLEEPDAPVELRYNAFVRHYAAGDARITEVVTTAVTEPVVVVHYEWEGEVEEIRPAFASNLRYMWPYDERALGSLYHGFSAEKGCYAVMDAGKEFVSLVGANVPARLLEEGPAPDRLEVRATLALATRGQRACDVVLAAGSEGVAMAEKAYDKAVRDPEAVFTESAAFYENYLASHASITSPDPVFDEGYRWALVSARQFLAETPGIGTALMAGYASSLRGWGGGHRISGRPGYAWYFGRDSELSALAFLSAGDFEAVRRTLEMLTDFQGIDGPVFHELTTSGSDHFDASDATPLMVVLMAEYLRASGDTDFVRTRLPHVYKAMDYCFSTDYNGDHLIEITHVGHGWLEGGDYFVPHTEFYLSGIWARALEDAAFLSATVGDGSRSAAYREEAALVRELLEDFWNPKGYYNYAKHEDGRYSEAFLALPSVPVWLGVTDPARSREMVGRYSADDFSTPWGVRQTNDARSEEQVSAYDESNIWPLFTGSVSLAEYYTGLSEEGYRHLMASLLCYRSATHGRVPEVLRGNSYRSGGITRFQCWSETAVTGPALQGLVGFRADETSGTVHLSPRPPKAWSHFEVKRLAAGSARLDMEMAVTEQGVCYTLHSTEPRHVEFSAVDGNGKEWKHAFDLDDTMTITIPAEI